MEEEAVEEELAVEEEEELAVEEVEEELAVEEEKDLLPLSSLQFQPAAAPRERLTARAFSPVFRSL